MISRMPSFIYLLILAPLQMFAQADNLAYKFTGVVYDEYYNPIPYTHVIASGTGIAPFHSMVKSYPDLDYQLIHGVRYTNEAYEREDYPRDRYILCTSRDDNSDFKGRVTTYLQQNDFDPKTSFYLCGNSDMIFDAMEILKEKGYDRDNVNVEVYF